jgi:hypothetical protein
MMASVSNECRFFPDELISLSAATQSSFKEMLAYTAWFDAQGVLFDFLLWCLIGIVPYGEHWLLLLPEFFITIGIFVMALLTSKMTKEKWAGIATVILCGSNVILLQFGNNLRAQAVSICFTALVLYFFYLRTEKFFSTKKISHAVPYGMALFLLVGAWHFSAILCFILFVFDVTLQIRNKSKFTILFPYFISGLLFLPYGIYYINHAGAKVTIPWFSDPALQEVFTVVPQLLADNAIYLLLFCLGTAMIFMKIKQKQHLQATELTVFASLVIIIFFIAGTYIHACLFEGSIWSLGHFLFLNPCEAIVVMYAGVHVMKCIARVDPSKNIIALILLTFCFWGMPAGYKNLLTSPDVFSNVNHLKDSAYALSAFDDIYSPSTAVYYSDASSSTGFYSYYVDHLGEHKPYNYLGWMGEGYEQYNTIYTIQVWNGSGSIDEKLLNEYDLISEMPYENIKVWQRRISGGSLQNEE